MRRAIIKSAFIYLLWVGVFMLQKFLFLEVYRHMIHAGAADWWRVIVHGLSMDCSVAGYLTIIPCLLTALGQWVPQRGIGIAARVYYALAGLATGCITLLDLTLYGYWGFRLDVTPIFYFTSSPGAAMASAEWWQFPLAAVGIALIAWGIYRAASTIERRFAPERRKNWKTTGVALLITGLLFIPIRGGFTVSTMNLSRAYFSNDQRLNHAAINPQFSLLYSATHQNNFGRQYREMEPTEAEQLMGRLNTLFTAATDSLSADATHNNSADSALLSCERPDIYLIILESFSSHLFPSLGGEAIATGLDSVASQGVMFTNHYASSFRTDRALPAILSGFPGQPSMSLMKYVEKTEKLPSIARTLVGEGYAAEYYYGGDINFTNMNAYLVNSGFTKTICDKDFPLGERSGKWGAHDHTLTARVLADARTRSGEQPRFTVVQTSSSHEPFEVPYQSGFPDKRVNAFSYTDSCVTALVDSLTQLPRYDKTLIVIVPDHYGAYPERPAEAWERHRVPLILAGGALLKKGLRVGTVGSQTDIAATLLGMLGIDATDFGFSHNLLQDGKDSNRGYAWFSEPGLVGLITARDTVVYDCDGGRTMEMRGPEGSLRLDEARAYLQSVYSRISEL